MKILKKIFIVLLILVVLFFLTTFILSRLVNITLIGDKDIYLNLNEEYFENGYKANFFGNNIDNITVESNIDNTKMGDYNVKYSTHFLFYKITATRNVYVTDKESPIITLKGEKYTYLKENEEYKEVGYEATDNIDGDITSNVEVTSNLDNTKIGTYEITYKVKDNCNNETVEKRQIEVIKEGLLTSGINNFWLKGSFDDVILKYDDKEYDYFKDTVFLGDSNTTFLYLKGNFISASQTWGKNNLNIAHMNNSTFPTLINKQETTLNNALNTYKPKYLIVTTGINADLYMSKENYLREIETMINNMKTKHKDTKLIFNGEFPISKNGTLTNTLQNKINEYNYYLVELCHKHKINFINFSDEIRGSDGYANDSFFDFTVETDKGFHLNKAGREKYIDYIKHLDFERSIQ